MFKAIKEFFFGKQPQAEQPNQAPYKVEVPPMPVPAPAPPVFVDGHGDVREVVKPTEPPKPEVKSESKPAPKTRAKATNPKPKAPATKKPRAKKSTAVEK